MNRLRVLALRFGGGGIGMVIATDSGMDSTNPISPPITAIPSRPQIRARIALILFPS